MYLVSAASYAYSSRIRLGTLTTSTLLSWNILLDRASAPSLCNLSNVMPISFEMVPACCANALRGGLAEPFAACFSWGVSSDCRDDEADCFCCRFACATMLENSDVRFCMPIVGVVARRR